MATLQQRSFSISGFMDWEPARRILRLWGCCLLWALAFGAASWLAMTSYILATDIASQQDALRAASTLSLQGRHLAPVREANNLRGERSADYWCFKDGLCFYAVDRFRSLYPTYNDLDEDELLLAELHQEAAAPVDVFNRKMDWRPIWLNLRAMIAPLCLLAVAIYGLARFKISARGEMKRTAAKAISSSPRSYG
jgi:hypothetical protein